MYFWKYKQLALDFLNNKVTEKQKMAYVVVPAFFTFFALVIKFILSLKQKINIENNPIFIGLEQYVLQSIVIIEMFFTLAVMMVVYKINSKIDDKDLLSRYFAFKFISMIRAGAFIIFLMLLLFIIKFNSNSKIIEIDLHELIIFFIVTSVYSYHLQIESFLYLKKCYKNISSFIKNKVISRKEDKKKSNRIIKKRQ